MWGEAQGNCCCCKLSSEGRAKGQAVQKRGECKESSTTHTNKVLTEPSVPVWQCLEEKE